MNMEMLRDQHDEIAGLARDLRSAVATAVPTQPVAPVRWRLARLLIAHLAVEDRYLYPAMVASQDTEARMVAVQFQAEMGTLATVFTTYMAAWTDQSIAERWTAFADETRAVLDALEQRVHKENTVLYPLAAPGWISLPPLERKRA